MSACHSWHMRMCLFFVPASPPLHAALVCDGATLQASLPHGRSQACAPCPVLSTAQNYALPHSGAPPRPSFYLATWTSPALHPGLQTTIIGQIIGQISIGSISTGQIFKGLGFQRTCDATHFSKPKLAPLHTNRLSADPTKCATATTRAHSAMRHRATLKSLTQARAELRNELFTFPMFHEKHQQKKNYCQPRLTEKQRSARTIQINSAEKFIHEGNKTPQYADG